MGPQQSVDVVRHDDPCKKIITGTNKAVYRNGHKIGNLRAAQPASTHAGTEQCFNLVGVSVEKSLFFAPSERAFCGSGILNNGFALVLEPKNGFAGQGIAQTKFHKIRSPLTLKMR